MRSIKGQKGTVLFYRPVEGFGQIITHSGKCISFRANDVRPRSLTLATNDIVRFDRYGKKVRMFARRVRLIRANLSHVMSHDQFRFTYSPNLLFSNRAGSGSKRIKVQANGVHNVRYAASRLAMSHGFNTLQITHLLQLPACRISMDWVTNPLTKFTRVKTGSGVAHGAHRIPFHYCLCTLAGIALFDRSANTAGIIRAPAAHAPKVEVPARLSAARLSAARLKGVQHLLLGRCTRPQKRR